MIEQDTIRLMRQCGFGIKMGVSAIDQVYDNVCADKFKVALNNCRSAHIKLGNELSGLLDEYGQEDSEPGPMLKSMSKLKTNMSLAMDSSDKGIADLLTDGCNMGIKNLNSYLNKYKAADERSKDITKRLCELEQKLVIDMRAYL